MSCCTCEVEVEGPAFGEGGADGEGGGAVLLTVGLGGTQTHVAKGEGLGGEEGKGGRGEERTGWI
jgi:hypothetical protein